jgi:oligoribonuclease (3'-5' exoribonuclease)
MTPRRDLIVFLDLECTGNADDDDIIEVGAVALRWPGLAEVGWVTQSVKPSLDHWQRMAQNATVWKMHTDNGLVETITRGDYVDPPEVDQALCGWLDQLTGGDKTHVPLGGSGVSHFDRKYMVRQLPLFNKRLTYWALDVGVVRRMYEMVGNRWPSQDAKTHRALDDARFHADEFRYAIKQMEGS